MRTFALSFLLLASAAFADPVTFDARTAKSGAWSDPATWGGRTPRAGERVQISTGHIVTYDVESQDALRMVHVSGTLKFSREKNTLLEVGLLRVAPGDVCSEDGFDCHDEAVTPANGALPALEIGTPNEPIPVGISAKIRLRYFEGMNRETLPAIVACNGRWDIHGAPMPRTWLKLNATAQSGSNNVSLEKAPDGWRVGDRVIVTGSSEREFSAAVDKAERGGYAGTTEERVITGIEGSNVVLDRPLERSHFGEGMMKSEMAVLSRNVVVESAEPTGTRGHTMYHRDSSGGISYAEFRHLGKRGVLGKYAIHFHLVRDTMRGSGVTGASIWDSDNRWITVHGTDHLLVRDCVGYRSRGHGYFLEDATEEWNVFDRNLAVQAIRSRPLPKQVLPFDSNDGAGFWWANGRNTFTRNVSCENAKYGFRFQIEKSRGFDPTLRVRGVDGKPEERDVRSIPFARFEDNESHTEGLYSFFLGDDENGSVRGDRAHPFTVRNLRAWETHYVLRPNMQFFLCEGLRVKNAVYGVYHPDFDAHVYRDLHFDNITAEPINRGHDDESVQYGDFTFERVTLENCKPARDPLIQMACTAMRDGVSGHFRDLQLVNSMSNRGKVVDLGGGPRNDDLQFPVSYYFHDPSGTRRVVSAKFPGALPGGQLIENWTGRDVRAKEITGVEFPALLAPKDDLPPATMITSVKKEGEKLRVRGVAQDNGEIAAIRVNQTEARILSQQAGVADWEVLVNAGPLSARSIDAAGNEERWPHEVPTR